MSIGRCVRWTVVFTFLPCLRRVDRVSLREGLRAKLHHESPPIATPEFSSFGGGEGGRASCRYELPFQPSWLVQMRCLPPSSVPLKLAEQRWPRGTQLYTAISRSQRAYVKLLGLWPCCLHRWSCQTACQAAAMSSVWGSCGGQTKHVARHRPGPQRLDQLFQT